MSSRDRMLEAAISIIEERGEAGVRVDEVAAMAEVAKPSLYHFFGSRDGLVAAAQAERYRRTHNRGLDDVIARAEACTSAEEFETLLRTWWATYSDERGIRGRAARLQVLGSSVSRPELQVEVAKSAERAAAKLVELGRLGQSRGWMLQSTDLDLEDVALWLHALWNGRYLAEISGDPDRIEGWDRVNTTAVMLLLFGRN